MLRVRLAYICRGLDWEELIFGVLRYMAVLRLSELAVVMGGFRTEVIIAEQ